MQEANVPASQQARFEQWQRLPAEMRGRPQWLLAGRNGKGELKVPTSVDATGRTRPGSSTDTTTWLPFERAVDAAMRHGLGIGYVLSIDDPFACIDLDVKPDTPSDRIERFDSIVAQFDSYTERSQGGRGFHVWCLGKIGKGRKRDGVELYSQERFIACTGNVVHDRPLQHRQHLLDSMVSQMPAATAELEEAQEVEADADLLERARRAANADKFVPLWAGQWAAMGYPSQSEADMALMGMLAFYSQANEQCRRLFRQSGLGQRDKAMRDDYIDGMLKVVRARQVRDDGEAGSVEHGRRIAEALLARMRPPPRSDSVWATVSVADVCTNPSPPVEFLIEDLLPAREVTLLPADGGAGKSMLTLIAAVHQAMGLPFMGKAVKRCKVIFYSGEDDARVLRGRLRRICEHYDVNPHSLAEWLMVIDTTDSPCLFTEVFDAAEGRRAVPTRNLEELGRLMQEWSARALVIDNASDTFAANENVRQHVSAFVRELKQIAKAHDAAVWLLAHLDKASVRGEGGRAKFSGSTAWHNSVRSRLLLVPDPDRPDQLVLSQEKSNHGRRSAPIELAWTPEGVLIHAGGGVPQSIPTPEELQRLILSLIRSHYDRGQYISTSLAPNAPTGAYAVLSADPSYPSGVEKARLATLLRQAQAARLLDAEAYEHPTRRGHTAERWKVL